MDRKVENLDKKQENNSRMSEVKLEALNSKLEQLSPQIQEFEGQLSPFKILLKDLENRVSSLETTRRTEGQEQVLKMVATLEFNLTTFEQSVKSRLASVATIDLDLRKVKAQAEINKKLIDAIK